MTDRERICQSDSNSRTEDETQEVLIHLNGAFFTGVAIESDSLLLQGYKSIQQAVASELGGKDEGWAVPRTEEKRWFSSAEVYPTLVPLRFLMREVNVQQEDGLQQVDHLLPEGVNYRAERFRIEYFDFGVGVASVDIRLQLPGRLADWPVNDICDDIGHVVDEFLSERLSSELGRYRTGCQRLLGEAFSPHSWYQGSDYEARPDGDQCGQQLMPTRSGELLWLHRTYILEGDRESLGADRKVAETLLPSACVDVPYPNFHLIAGISATVIISHESALTRKFNIKSGDLLAVMSFQWAVLAVLMEADRALFRRVNRFASEAHLLKPSSLSEEIDRIHWLRTQVFRFQGLCDSVLIDWGESVRAGWNGMAEVQGMGPISSSIQKENSTHSRDRAEHC